jgi:hypothetical protein
MAYVTRIRLRFQPDTGQRLERFYAERLVPGRQALYANGDLHSMALLRIQTPGDPAETYELVSYWANKAAHDRNEDSPIELMAYQLLARYLATPGRERRRSERAQRIARLAAYGGLSVLLVLLYVGSIVGLQTMVVRATGQTSPLLLVVTTLAFAALFQMGRKRIQVVIDRRFFRRKYAAAQTVAAFGDLARDEVDVARLTDRLLAIVTEAMQPEYATLWLLSPTGALQEAGRTRLIQPVMSLSSAPEAQSA